MKNRTIIVAQILVAVAVAWTFTGCSLFGLDLQKDYNRKPHILDPEVHMSAWDYLKKRSVENDPDSIFKFMYDAIIYSGIDTNLYTQSGNTFILLHNDAINRVVKKVTQPDCFFGANPVNGKPATSWSDYPKETVKDYLMYLIVIGEFTHVKNLTINDTLVSTMLPTGTWPENQASKMALEVLNASPSNTNDYPIRINDSVNVRTSDLIPTNGVIQVVDRYIPTRLP
jgi:hypothetical protein